jgi:predicted secreted hydrolase
MKNSLRHAAALFTALLLFQPLAAQYRTAVPGYRFEFPRDFFSHPDFQTEWWYYTGNLTSSTGRHFGFELTFFREAVDRNKPNDVKGSAWDVRDLYIAHLALSDLDGQHFYHRERLNRAGPGIAGSDASSSRIWNGNWQIHWRDSDDQQLQAVDEQFQFHLMLHSEKPPILHGENGLSQKSAGLGHASYYFSLTRLAADGELVLENEKFKVTGLAWMDHEFFTQQLQPYQIGWDWLSIQLDDDTELMLFHLRRKDGSLDPFSAGTYIDAQGKSTHLRVADFLLEPLTDTWARRATGATYPISWKISVPKLGLNLEAHTKLANQEMAEQPGIAGALPAYWEGAISLSGRRGSASLNGVGYLEMTGYGKAVNLAP